MNTSRRKSRLYRRYRSKHVPSVHIGADHDKFLEKINLILRRQVAFNDYKVYEWLSQHTWEKRVATILDILKYNEIL
jgi:hypothetical protein